MFLDIHYIHILGKQERGAAPLFGTRRVLGFGFAKNGWRWNWCSDWERYGWWFWHQRQVSGLDCLNSFRSNRDNLARFWELKTSESCWNLVSHFFSTKKMLFCLKLGNHCDSPEVWIRLPRGFFKNNERLPHLVTATGGRPGWLLRFG